MKVKVCGFLPRAGISKKSGNAYDGVTLYYLKEVPGVTGHAVGDCFVSKSDLGNAPLSVGCDAEIEYNQHGYLEVFKVL